MQVSALPNAPKAITYYDGYCYSLVLRRRGLSNAPPEPQWVIFSKWRVVFKLCRKTATIILNVSTHEMMLGYPQRGTHSSACKMFMLILVSAGSSRPRASSAMNVGGDRGAEATNTRKSQCLARHPSSSHLLQLRYTHLYLVQAN